MAAIKKITIVILILIYAFRLWQTTGCQDFTSFNLNPLSISLRTTADINTDPGLPKSISRFFHNKITEGAYEIGKDLAGLFEPRLLLEILGPLGFLMLILALLETVKTKKTLSLINLGAILTVAVLMVLNLNQKIIFYLFAASLMLFSFWGIGRLQKIKYSLILILFLTAATFCYYSFSWQLSSFCSQIFFN